MAEFQLQRLGLVIEPDQGTAWEAGGILNPGVIRGRDGELYLFPRLVAQGNYSRIGIARVCFDRAGDPAGIERLGVALEPETDYELGPAGGGCEDPRVTYVEPLRRYVMMYTALSALGPRIAIAVSDDLFKWRRVGLATFRPHGKLEFQGVDNKDAAMFPVAVPDTSARPALAVLHRPLFPGTRPEEIGRSSVDLERESIWISYCACGSVGERCMMMKDEQRPTVCPFTSHHRLASPAADWELIKIGTGAPPVLTRLGWLVIYHGVSRISALAGPRQFRYSAGVMILSAEHPRFIVYRSPVPVLAPDTPFEISGVVPNVVFPTGIDRRDDIGRPDCFDIYYGMADNRIGVARLTLPDELPPDVAVDRTKTAVSAASPCR
jgi:predicted GH43/DUF377 family glycosyl hydrolase